jgi:nucleoside phosphorylase
MTPLWLRRTPVVIVCAVAAIAGVVVTTPAQAHPVKPKPACQPRTLVLSAMPIELGPLLTQEKVQHTVTAGKRTFYVGRLRGKRVVLGLTGIGPVNATRTTRQALRQFRCGKQPGINAVVFSGVAGGDFIGDVNVPTRWTKDNGEHFYGVNHRMLATARHVARGGHVPLEQKSPVGDPLCACVTDPDSVSTVKVTHKPKIEIGGAGQTTDPFSGRALPCVPGGGDIFGCDPCPAKKNLAQDSNGFAPGITPFIDPKFFTGYFSATSGESKKYVTEDEETAAVDAVAHAHHVPFLGFRAVSDGGGDPLNLPGFPFQFFYYRQISADNAALTTMAFLKAWRHR